MEIYFFRNVYLSLKFHDYQVNISRFRDNTFIEDKQLEISELKSVIVNLINEKYRFRYLNREYINYQPSKENFISFPLVSLVTSIVDQQTELLN